jgi:hypothetical protein
MLPNENIFGETSNTFSKYKEVSAEDIEKTAENMNDIQQRKYIRKNGEYRVDDCLDVLYENTHLGKHNSH